MVDQGFVPEAVAQQLGERGVDSLVVNAERVCGYEQQRIALINQGSILSLQIEHHSLLEEEHRLFESLRLAPPLGSLRRLYCKVACCSLVSLVLTTAGFAFTQLTLAPYRLGSVSWLISVGIAVLTPFVVHLMLQWSGTLVKITTLLTALGAIGSGMLLAEIRGDLMAQQITQNDAPVVILDDAQPQQEQGNTFYQHTLAPLRLALLLLALGMEVGAGLALHEATCAMPNSSEDWRARRGELATVRRRLAEIAHIATALRNEPGIFAARFWRDFYRALLSNAARNAMTKLLIVVFGMVLLEGRPALAEDRLNLVIAIDLTQSVNVAGPDGKTEFQKNIDGVGRLLMQVPAGSIVMVIGITDHSFTEPDVLMSAHVLEDAGYFGERLTSARSRLLLAWKRRSARLDAHYLRTDILGALRLASQIFAQGRTSEKKSLVIFSDMRQSTAELNLESAKTHAGALALWKSHASLPALSHVEVSVLGADGSGRSVAYWETVKQFWIDCFHDAQAALHLYSIFREIQLAPSKQ